jgi:hypothetical protein
MSVLIDILSNQFGDEADYLAYNIKDTVVTLGLPPWPVVGLDYIGASYNSPQVQRFPCLTGGGAFASAKGRSGIIEIGMLSSSASVAAVELLALTGVGFPIYSTDVGSAGTSFIFADACRLVSSPRWERSRALGITTFTFSTNRLIISHGVRLSDDD